MCPRRQVEKATARASASLGVHGKGDLPMRRLGRRPLLSSRQNRIADTAGRTQGQAGACAIARSLAGTRLISNVTQTLKPHGLLGPAGDIGLGKRTSETLPLESVGVVARCLPQCLETAEGFTAQYSAVSGMCEGRDQGAPVRGSSVGEHAITGLSTNQVSRGAR
jgi:hypothetical protein